MPAFRLIAVKADGTGFDHSWGDSYEVEHATYPEAEADVLGREGAGGTRPYTRIVKGWAKNGWRWEPLPACQECGSFPACTQWAGTGELICWTCCEARQGSEGGREQ